ncbi:MAG: hypothetical protein R3F61_18255 [Myxococcota bacterium]
MNLPSGTPASIQVFSVVRDGEFAGRRFRSGELAVVEGMPEEGDAVVLVAVGPGRPRLGRVVGNRLMGDRGEPCLMSRWEVAGRVAGVIRPVGTGWAVEMFDQPGIVGMAADAVTHGWEAREVAASGAVSRREEPGSPTGATVREPVATPQLSLFAA